MGLGVAALQTKAAEQGWPIGLFVAFLFLIGGAFALVFPFVCVLAFFAGLMGLAGGASNSFGDLTVWGVVSLILAVLSYFGWREKRKRRREEAARVVCQPVHPTLQNRRSSKFGCRPLGAANLFNNI
jgi:membrane protein implicated in regulation of membrane protease activity